MSGAAGDGTACASFAGVERVEAFLHPVVARSLDTALIMAADTISGYIQGLLDGVEFKQTAYALDRGSRRAALAQFLRNARGDVDDRAADDVPLAA